MKCYDKCWILVTGEDNHRSIESFGNEFFPASAFPLLPGFYSFNGWSQRRIGHSLTVGRVGCGECEWPRIHVPDYILVHLGLTDSMSLFISAYCRSKGSSVPKASSSAEGGGHGQPFTHVVSRNPLSSGPCPTIRSNSNSQGRPTKYILDLIFASWIFTLRFFTSPWLADNNSQRILHIYYLLCGTG